jgi:uracil-DNA glycosylase
MSTQQNLKFAAPSAKAQSLPKVEYDFPIDAKNWNGIAMVGEAPGAEEAKLGHPFVGRSGQLLDKMLSSAAIDRKQSLIANVFRYQPPGNKVDHFFISRRASKLENIAIAEEFGQFGSAYCRADYAVDIENLATTLKKIQPKIILALGRVPLWALTGENGLLERVGKPLPCRLMDGVKVIPTYHPSFILRGNWGLQDAWLGHFLAAKKYT